MEDFIRALGAEPVIYPMRNECCGGYVVLEDKALPKAEANIGAASAAGIRRGDDDNCLSSLYVQP